MDSTLLDSTEGRRPGRGTRHPATKAVLGVAWFCTAVTILWFFGSLAMAPWQAASRSGGLMPLPGGGQFDLTLGRGATARCAVRVTRNGTISEVVIMQGTCNTIAAHRWIMANRELPEFQGATLGTPYTVAPAPEAEELATHTRVVVSSLFSLAASLAGAILMVGSIALATRLMESRKGT